MMLFVLQKFPLIVDLLFLVRCNCLQLLLQLNDANELFEQLLEKSFLFPDWGLAECCSCFSRGIGQLSFIMAVQQFLWLGIVFILHGFVRQRKIGCRFLISLSLGLRIVEYFIFYLNFLVDCSCTQEKFSTFLLLNLWQSIQYHLYYIRLNQKLFQSEANNVMNCIGWSGPMLKHPYKGYFLLFNINFYMKYLYSAFKT